eukprot:1817028-Rhodomonas_salina.2
MNIERKGEGGLGRFLRLREEPESTGHVESEERVESDSRVLVEVKGEKSLGVETEAYFESRVIQSRKLPPTLSSPNRPRGGSASRKANPTV